MTLVEHLGALYTADVLHKGDFATSMELLKTEMALDPTLQTEATAKLSQLTNINRVRGGSDFATKMQIKYLTEALAP